MKKRKKGIRLRMKKHIFKKMTSVILSSAMLVSTMSVFATYKTAEAKEKGISYAFASDSFVAKEKAGKDSEMQITITRSGEIAKASKVVLVSYDVSAEYGKDYTLFSEGISLQKKESVTSMYRAFRDNRVISNYEEDNQAFLNGLLNQSGYSVQENNELVPVEENQTKDKEKTSKSNLSDADEAGINIYDSLSILDKIGADSTRMVLDFAPGEKTKVITLSVKSDQISEYDESFFLSIVSTEVNQCLKMHKDGIPDIPLKHGRDIAVTSVAIADSSKEEPVCTVQAEQENYTIPDGNDKVTVSFPRTGALETFSTVILKKNGEAYGCFYYAPYQEIQEADLEAGEYEIIAQKGCTVSDRNTFTVEKTAKKTGTHQTVAGKESSKDLDTIYAYDALPSGNTTAKTNLKKSSESKTKSDGNPLWFPEWARECDETDYIGHMKQDSSLFWLSSDSEFTKGYCDAEYITDKKKEHASKSVYNTWRMDTSGFLSGTKDSSVCVKSYSYDLTGIESVEACYFVDDTDLRIVLGLDHGQLNDNIKEDTYVDKKGDHTVKLSLPSNVDLSSEIIYFRNYNDDKYDGAEVFLANALKFNKRTYQIQIQDSNTLDFISKSGSKDITKAAKVVADDRYSYLKMDEGDISINMSIDETYPMALTGYQLIRDDQVKPYDGTKQDLTSTKIPFSREFVKNNWNHCQEMKREGSDTGYATFIIQPIMEKIKLDEFSILNVDKNSTSQSYKGKLVCENDVDDLCQGDYAVLSAEDLQPGYTFSGVYVKRWTKESSEPTTCIYDVESDNKVTFKLEKDITRYEVEPIFSGHEADIITVSYMDGAKEHGVVMNDTSNQTEAASSEITIVKSEEYQKNSYVPLIAKPNEGYLTCWYSGYRTYYGDTFYYQMDGNIEHNSIKVDFIKKGDASIETKTTDLDLLLYESEVNLRNNMANVNRIPLSDIQVVTSTGETYKATTDQNGKTVLKNFEGVVGGMYSMMIFKNGENRYRYVNFIFTGSSFCGIEVPAFAGMSAYPEKVSVDINGTSEEQLYIDLTNTGEVNIVITVYRPDADTRLGKVNLAFVYDGTDTSGKQVMSKKEYTIDSPDSADSTGVYHTYSIKVPSTEIPNMSTLYVDVNSSYDMLQTSSDGKVSKPITIDCSTGYVNTGYNFKEPNESSELSVLKEVPELPGMETAGEDVSIPFIGSLDFGFTAKNGVYFARQDDPNNPDVWYFLSGYNAVSTWTKTLTDRYEGAKATRAGLKQAEAAAAKKAGDLNGSGSNFVKLKGKPVINIAPTVSLKLVMQDMADGSVVNIGYDAVIGLDEMIIYNMPFSIYGVPCYLNITFNGEQFVEVHASGKDFESVNVQNAITKPSSGTEMAYYFQIPNLDLTLKTGVGYNAFAGIYVSVGGNLKMNLEYSDKWRCGGYFYLKGGIGLDCVVFGGEVTVKIPKSENTAFGDEKARSYIHAATKTLKQTNGSENSITDVYKRLNETLDDAETTTTFKVTRNQNEDTVEDSTKLNTVLKPASKNVEMQLVNLSKKKIMAMTLADNGAPADSLNYLSGVYSISEDGGKTWKSKQNISQSDKLQWNVKYHKLKNKILLTWSEGDLDAATGEKMDANSKYKPAEVAKAMKCFDLMGRYFDLDGNPIGESFTIAKDNTAALSALDASENQDGTVDFYYERRAYSDNTTTLTELMSQEQTICFTVLDENGRTETEDKRVLVQSEDGTKNYRITELKAFDYKGVKGQVVVLDSDGKLVQETEDGEKPSIEDRQIFVRVVSDANGNIPAGTLMPITDAGICAQSTSIIENNDHIYLFWNQNGNIKCTSDFIPTTQDGYQEWCKCAGGLGCYTLLSATDSLAVDSKFRVAMNQKGKGILLWKNSDGTQFSDDSLASQINAGMFTTDTSGNIVSSVGPVTLSDYISEINNLDLQVLEDGTTVLCFTQLDGKTMYESNDSNAVVDTVEDNIEVKFSDVITNSYPIPGKEYTSYFSVWNSGMVDADNLVISASGAVNGSASLKELVGADQLAGSGVLSAGKLVKVKLPVKASDSFADGDEVVYTISRNGKTLETYKETVRKGAYIVPQKMPHLVSIPGTNHYQVSMTVTNIGNQSGTTDVKAYTFDQGIENKSNGESRTFDYKDNTVVTPGGTAVLSFVLKNVAHKDDALLHMIGFMTGDSYNQSVEGALPDRRESLRNAGNMEQPGDTDITTPKKGDILTLGTKSTRAKYKVTSSNTVTYYRVSVPSGTTSAKVPDTIKISGKTYKVTAISSDAFKGNKKLKKITLGKNVSQIPAKAFYKQKKLKTLTILSTKINKIGSSAFAGCDKLTTFTLKSKKLSKKSVKNSLKGSKLKSIKTMSSLKKKYKKLFTKKNAGRKVKIK